MRKISILMLIEKFINKVTILQWKCLKWYNYEIILLNRICFIAEQNTWDQQSD